MINRWITAERGRFILFLPVFMATGIIAYFAQTAEPSATAALWPAAAALLALAGAWRWRLPRAAALCLAFATLGFANAWWQAARAPPWDDLPTGGTIVSGTISLVEMLPKGRRITLQNPSLDGADPLGRALRIRLRTTDLLPLSACDQITVKALVRPPAPPDVPGGWDTQRDAYFADIAGYGFAVGPSHRTASAPASRWQTLRETIAGRILAVLPGARGAIAATLLTGLGTAIPPDDRAAFQDSGLAHLLAVAGLHIGIVMALVFGIVRVTLSLSEYAALHWPIRRVASLAALAAGGLYLVLTGAHLPIIRSFAMASLFTLGILTGRRAFSLRSLAFAALLILLWSPFDLMSVGFQMSFSAVLALIACAEVLPLARLRTGRWWSTPALYLAGLILTSLVAGTASLPFAAYHFGRATLYYVPANLLAVPLTAFWVLPWGIAALLLMPFGLERLALVPMGAGIDGLLAIAHTVAAWPGAARDIPQIPPEALAMVAIGMSWLGLWRTRLRLLGLAPLAAGLLLPLFTIPPDIIIGPHADVIAAKLGGTILIEHARRATELETEAPPRLWGVTRAEDFPASGEAAAGAAQCDANACRLHIRTQDAILLRNAGTLPCGATLLISAEILRAACAGTPLADRDLVRHTGAVAIHLTETGPRFTTDHDRRGRRPWVIEEPTLLPPAPTE